MGLRRLVALVAAAVGMFTAAPGAPAEGTWKPVSAAEREATAPEIEPDAPAEIISHDILVDDHAYPVTRRTREYVRLKVFEPSAVENLTRISQQWQDDAGDEVEIRARLTLPDGTTTDFGADAVRERSLARAGRSMSFLERMVSSRDDNEVKEKFLAITGVTAGAVIEIEIERKQRPYNLVLMRVLQRATTPARQITFTHIAPPKDDFDHLMILLNPAIGNATLTEDAKKRTSTITATRVPSFVEEPLAGAVADYALVALSSYLQKDIGIATRGRELKLSVDPRKDGPWSPLAARTYLMQEGFSATTPRTRELARELTAGAATREAAAIAIHDYTRDLFQAYRQRKKSGRTPDQRAASLDDVIDWRARHDQRLIQTHEFARLAYALFRDAGFETSTVRVSDRRLVRFNPALVCFAFLPEECLAVKVDSEWRFSAVTSSLPLPFNTVPWYLEGQACLRAKDGAEEFIGIPYTPAEKSIVATSGELRVDEKGALAGTLTRKLTGHAAIALRERVRDQPPASQLERIRQWLQSDLGFDELEVSETKNLDAIGRSIDVIFRVRHARYATATGDRLILRADPLRIGSRSPFTTEKRRAAIQFPFAWGESDRVTLVFPPGYAPEGVPAPRTLRHGQYLAFAMQIKLLAGQPALQIRREFGVMDWLFEATEYAPIKAWFDAVSSADAAEIVLTKTALAAPGAP